jgi:hypothetical protein
MATVTGSAGTAISAQVTVANDGALATQADQTVTAQSIVDDLATMKSGSYTTTAARTVGSGGSDTFNTGTKATLHGRSILWPARAAVSDANHNLSCVGSLSAIFGKRFFLAYPTANRTHTLMSSAGYTPDEGETMTIILYLAFSGPTWTITLQREDTTVVAVFTPDTAVPINTVLVAEVEFVSGVWRLGSSTGIWNNAGTFYGVIAGPGA